MSIVNLPYKMVDLEKEPNLKMEDARLNKLAFPEFVLYDKEIIKFWEKLKIIFSKHQLLMLNTEDAVIATINTFPIFYPNTNLFNLPDAGIRWVVKKSFENHQNKEKPNTLVGGLVSINPEFKNKGISHSIVAEMIKFAKNQQYERLIIPLRPNMKQFYPLVSIKKYALWKTIDDLPFDPWLRAHVKQGAKIIKPCLYSSITKGSIKEWEKWTKIKFPDNGKYIIPGGLTPLKINHSKDLGTYAEPNIWISHELEIT